MASGNFLARCRAHGLARLPRCDYASWAVLQNLSEIVVEAGLATGDQMRDVAKRADQSREPLVVALVKELAVDEFALVSALAKHTTSSSIDPGDIEVDPEAIRQVPRELCERLKVMPLSMSLPGASQTLKLAAADPTDAVALAEVKHVCGCAVETLITPLSTIESLVQRYYRELVTEVMPRKRDTLASALANESTVIKRAKPTTKPHHQISEEADLSTRFQALVQLLEDKGLVSEAELAEAIRARLKARGGES